MAEKTFGFYRIDPDYLEYLNSADSEVYYDPSYRKAVKPFLGVTLPGGERYFIPLSSPKEKHKRWKNVAAEHLLVYEIKKKTALVSGEIYKPYSDKEVIHVLGVVDIKKMIPAPRGEYKRIEFGELEDKRYKSLFQREYKFCLKNRDKILARVEKLRAEQIEKGVVHHWTCDFQLLEFAKERWEKEKEKLQQRKISPVREKKPSLTLKKDRPKQMDYER